MKRFAWLFLIIIFFCPLVSRAALLKPNYPRLANYFLKWQISDVEATQLAKWDVLVLDMEVAKNSPAQLQKIRLLNPRIIILAYVTSEEIVDKANEYNQASMRQDLASQIIDGWYLKDASGRKISNWPYTSMLNLTDGAALNNNGQRFNDYLPSFVAQKIQATGFWDGVFYDNTWGDISWLNNGNLDLNNDGVIDSATKADKMWSDGFKKMLAKTRELTGNDFSIVGNGRDYYGYQSFLNGMMLEDFPSAWESNGNWVGSLNTYLNLPGSNVYPQTSIIDTLDKNQENYQHFRFGLASALLGDGFYGFDSDIYNHAQTWWYGEYNVNLGPAQSAAYNLLSTTTEVKAGLWRRDFKNGLALVNSTNQKQNFVFSKEDLERIKGTQAPLINSGERINYIELAPQDGVILLKRTTVIQNSPFLNGYFFRVFDLNGQQVKNSFFSYAGGYPGGASLILTPGTEDQVTSLVANRGQVDLYENGRSILKLKPYNNLFKNQLNLAAEIVDNSFQKIVTGPTAGGGPQVRVYTVDGRLRASFFAYDAKYRGGVNVALGDVDGDGQLEVVTTPGTGLEPQVKIFNLSGVLKSSFLAYDAKFKGGVNLAVGDLNSDGRAEIITGPAGNNAPQIRVFDGQGQILASFLAYEAKYQGGITVAASDLNNDGKLEILAGLKNFY